MFWLVLQQFYIQTYLHCFSFKMNNTTSLSAKPEGLPIFMCLLIDNTPNGTECSEIHPNKCVLCKVRSDYLTGESVDDYGSPGHIICLILWILSASTGIMGTLGNILIMAVLKRRPGSDKGFDFLLIVLAVFDMLCCIMCVLASTCHVIWHGNWSGRGIVLLYVFYLAWIFLLFSRSASQFMTVAITIERWLVITFPFRSVNWFTSRKTKALSATIVIIAFLLAVPRFTSRYVTANPYRGHEHGGYHIHGLRDLHYYLSSTSLTAFWRKTLKSIHYQIDFWLPLPMLLLFNFLSFLQVRRLSLRRKEMKMKEKQEIQAVQMFLPVVVILLICNLGPISMFYMVHFVKLLYREMYMLTIFSICITSSVNFLIYYFRGNTFKPEARNLLHDWFGISKPTKKATGTGNESNSYGSSSKGVEMTTNVSGSSTVSA